MGTFGAFALVSGGETKVGSSGRMGSVAFLGYPLVEMIAMKTTDELRNLYGKIELVHPDYRIPNIKKDLMVRVYRQFCYWKSLGLGSGGVYIPQLSDDITWEGFSELCNGTPRLLEWGWLFLPENDLQAYPGSEVLVVMDLDSEKIEFYVDHRGLGGRRIVGPGRGSGEFNLIKQLTFHEIRTLGAEKCWRKEMAPLEVD